MSLLRQVVDLLQPDNGSQPSTSTMSHPSVVPHQPNQAESVPSSSQGTTNQAPQTTNQPSTAIDEHHRFFNWQSVNYLLLICKLHATACIKYEFLRYSCTWLYVVMKGRVSVGMLKLPNFYYLENSTLYKEKNCQQGGNMKKGKPLVASVLLGF